MKRINKKNKYSEKTIKSPPVLPLIKAALCSSLLLCASAATLSQTLLIQDIALDIESIHTEGSGCPQGTASVRASDDQQQMLVTLSEYDTRITETRVASSDCNIALTFNPGAGYAVGIVSYTWHGSASIGEETFANFHREYFIHEPSGLQGDKNWMSSEQEDFVVVDRARTVDYYGCGESMIARSDSSVTIVGSGEVTLYNSDKHFSMSVDLEFKECQ